MMALLGEGALELPPQVVTFPGERTKFSSSLWANDPDLQLLRRKMLHTNFMEDWAKCSGLYHSGHWAECADRLSEFQGAFVSANGCRDGPADYLLGLLIQGYSSSAGSIVDDPGHVKLKRVPHWP